MPTVDCGRDSDAARTKPSHNTSPRVLEPVYVGVMRATYRSELWGRAAQYSRARATRWSRTVTQVRLDLRRTTADAEQWDSVEDPRELEQRCLHRRHGLSELVWGEGLHRQLLAVPVRCGVNVKNLRVAVAVAAATLLSGCGSSTPKALPACLSASTRAGLPHDRFCTV